MDLFHKCSCSSILVMFPYSVFQAKALAEKNTRDLLAQKEEAEKNVTCVFNGIQ